MGIKSQQSETKDSSKLFLSIFSITSGQHTKTIESSQVENSNIFIYENKIKYCFTSCNCFGLIKTQIVEIQLSGINYTLRKLYRSQYKHQA
ncbi:unnamed protein product (macronuclear) [Paramecium tetraurelia]|uniref:Uncharacterized protein n=1 Tax=Paramecium tetraurelia TaxID=5888 RepID=A0DP18_PARTE|nr:uncharacterized protein GSPATT00018981001 [Paramecium tetraurelia]CAK84785.1 unnamed protein product [Paramecium tetraurelia]|eukprot:XP_001452182.1 hypothetical protein (macronuclear) [Paramecium tetraurelia strain d4-2]